MIFFFFLLMYAYLICTADVGLSGLDLKAEKKNIITILSFGGANDKVSNSLKDS